MEIGGEWKTGVPQRYERLQRLQRLQRLRELGDERRPRYERLRRGLRGLRLQDLGETWEFNVVIRTPGKRFVVAAEIHAAGPLLACSESGEGCVASLHRRHDSPRICLTSLIGQSLQGEVGGGLERQGCQFGLR